MRKKPTNDDVAKLIKDLAEEVRSQLDFELRVAQSNLNLSERELIDSFTDEQKQLYEQYIKDRQRCTDLYIQTLNKN